MGKQQSAAAASPEQNIRRKEKEGSQRFYDFSLLADIIFLCCFGLIMVYSSSSYTAQIKTGDSLFYLKKQLFALVIGLPVMLLVSKFDYRKILRVGWFHIFVAVCALVLMVAVEFTPFGISFNGQKRWFGIAGKSLFQAAEPVKLALIIFVAYMVSKYSINVDTWKFQLRVVVAWIITIGLVLVRNLSSGLILLGILFIMLFVSSKKKARFAAAVLAVIALAVCGIFLADYLVQVGILKEYQVSRILVWQNPEKYMLKGGYQVLQGLYAIGSGGLFGKGLGASMQKLGFVPEAQNDMVFSIICEELGLFGAVCVMLLFLFMIWRFMVIANNAPDVFGGMLVTGIMAHIALQVVLNIAVVTNTIPNTGITLPFISYGGTSMLFLMIEMGIALSVSNQIVYKR